MLETVSSWPAWYLAAVLGYAVFLAGIAVHDVRSRRIPNVAVYPAIGVAALFAFLQPAGPWWSYWLAGLGAGVFFVALGILSRGGLGFGDAKLATLIGLMAGWPGVLVALFVAFPVGAAAALGLIAAGRIGRRDPIPFGPALVVGALVATLAGRQLAGLVWPGLGAPGA